MVSFLPRALAPTPWAVGPVPDQAVVLVPIWSVGPNSLAPALLGLPLFSARAAVARARGGGLWTLGRPGPCWPPGCDRSVSRRSPWGDQADHGSWGSLWRLAWELVALRPLFGGTEEEAEDPSSVKTSNLSWCSRTGSCLSSVFKEPAEFGALMPAGCMCEFSHRCEGSVSAL